MSEYKVRILTPEEAAALYATKAELAAVVGGEGGGGGVVAWGSIIGVITDQTDLQTALTGKQNQLVAGSGISIDITNPLSPVISSTGGGGGGGVPNGGTIGQIIVKQSSTNGDVAWATPTKTTVGLSLVDNTSDANKPISSATQTALNTKVTGFTDPGADRIVFWDDSANAYAPLALGVGLSISGTTLSSTATAGAATSFDIEMESGYYNFPSTIGTAVIRINTYGPTAPNSTNIKINGVNSATLPTYIGLGAGKARHRWNYDDEVA